MYLENNNIKVLKIFFKFSIEKSMKIFRKFRKIFRKFRKFFRKYRKCFRKFSKFLQNLENMFFKKN